MATTEPAGPDADQRARIAALNDAARAGQLANARTVFTHGLIELLAGDEVDAAKQTLRLLYGQRTLVWLMRHTPIAPTDDPYGERDFGVLHHMGHKIYWKIDVYENDGRFCWGAAAPWDETLSIRVITLMLASEY